MMMMMMMMMLKPFHASEFFLHRLFVRPFSLFSPFFLPFTSVSFLLLLLPGFAVFLLGGGTQRGGAHLAFFNQGSAGGEMAETSPRQVGRAGIGAGERASPRAAARLSLLTIGTAGRLPRSSPPMASARRATSLLFLRLCHAPVLVCPPLGPRSPRSWSPRGAMSLLPLSLRSAWEGRSHRCAWPIDRKIPLHQLLRPAGRCWPIPCCCCLVQAFSQSLNTLSLICFSLGNSSY